MPTRYVQMPDGRYLEWPDGVSPADFKARAQKLAGPQKPVDTSKQPPRGDLRAMTTGERLLTNYPVGVKGEGFGENMKNIAQNAGVGVAQVGHALLHPIDTIGNLASSLTPGTKTPNPIQSTYQALNERPGEVAPQIFGQSVAAGALGRASAPAVRGTGAALQRGAGAVNDALIGTPVEGLHGATPGLEMAKQGVTGMSPAGLTRKLAPKISEAATENRAILANHTGPPINTGPMIQTPFDEQIAAGSNPATGAASPTQLRTAGRTARELTHEIDPDAGVTPMMRNPNRTPLEAARLKSNIYDRTNYDPQGHNNLSNTGLKGAAHNLKEGIETAVPASIPSGRSLHSLVQAKEILDPAARAQLGIDASKSGLIGKATMGLGTQGASGMYGVGSVLQSPAAPPILAAPAIGAINARKKTEDQQ